jgi:hypothetical protein
MGQISVAKNTVNQKYYIDKLMSIAEDWFLFEKFRIGQELDLDKLKYTMLITNIICK